MSRKPLAQVFVLILILVALLAVPGNARAGGVCGGTYVVEWGDTLDKIAAMCGTTVSAIYAANPGISGYLYAGQILVIPGSDYCNCPPVSYKGTYIVQYGDTFSGIALLYGVSIKDLWAANPQIWNINYLYAGQVINIPGSSWFSIVPTRTETPVSLSYGSVPAGTPYGKIKLSNKAKTEVYVSLQGTTRDGFHVINEYPVGGTMEVKVPAGWYIYVAWVGGRKFDGQFKLGGGSDHSITFYRDRIVVD
ncbi:MAG TPA: LysM domain-containing protein [Anaerolineales bacterium]|nr:LysM domain-containing protein [Anaerolineales bacterium]